MRSTTKDWASDFEPLIPMRQNIAQPESCEFSQSIIRDPASGLPVLHRPLADPEMLRQFSFREYRLDQTTRLFRQSLVVDDVDDGQDECGNRIYYPLRVLVLVHAFSLYQAQPY